MSRYCLCLLTKKDDTLKVAQIFHETLCWHRSVSRQHDFSHGNRECEIWSTSEWQIHFLFGKIPGFSMTNIQFPAERNLNLKLSKSKCIGGCKSASSQGSNCQLYLLCLCVNPSPTTKWRRGDLPTVIFIIIIIIDLVLIAIILLP